MKQTITKSMFRDEFIRMGRKDNFSYEGLGVLFDYLTETEDQSNEIELDVISLCCDFSELPVDDALVQYGASSLEELQDNHLVINVNETTVLVSE